MKKHYTVGSIFWRNYHGYEEMVIIARGSNYDYQFILFSGKSFSPLCGSAGDQTHIKEILTDYKYKYIGNVKDLDFESFIAERIRT